MIYQICEVMMSISTWDQVHLWMYLLNDKAQGIIQEFNLGVGSHMSITLFVNFAAVVFGGRGHLKPLQQDPLPILLYITSR